MEARNYNTATSFTTLLDAVKFSGMDLSYNAGMAHQRISQIEKGWGGMPFKGAFVENGTVYYMYTYNGATMVRKFDPFISVMDDSQLVLFREMGNTLVFDRHVAKCQENIKAAGKYGFIVG